MGGKGRGVSRIDVESSSNPLPTYLSMASEYHTASLKTVYL